MFFTEAVLCISHDVEPHVLLNPFPSLLCKLGLQSPKNLEVRSEGTSNFGMRHSVQFSSFYFS